jgi:hypothetical protein
VAARDFDRFGRGLGSGLALPRRGVHCVDFRRANVQSSPLYRTTLCFVFASVSSTCSCLTVHIVKR